MRPRLLILCALPLLGTGCYSVGFRPAAGLQEIVVPVFVNETLRREVEHDLTRHVRREVLEGTPLHLANEGEARAVLRGSVVAVGESVLVSGDAEEVLASSLTVSVVFGVYEGSKLLIGEDTNGDGRPDGPFSLQGYAEFNASRGEDRLSATDEALRDLAEMIVWRLQERYDDRMEPNDGPEGASLLTSGREVALVQRDPDWFKVVVPPRHALRATIFYSKGDLALSAHDANGAAAEAEIKDGGRLVSALGGEEPRTVFLRVQGDDSGAPYQLEVLVQADDGAEPDSTPQEAKALPGGQTRWRVHRLQRDDDYVLVNVPQGMSLSASLLGKAEGLQLKVTDAQGGQRIDVEERADGSLRVPAPERSEQVYLRVGGDGEGRPYTLQVELVAPKAERQPSGQ